MTIQIAEAFGVDPALSVPVEDEEEGECPNCKRLQAEVDHLRRALESIAISARAKTGMKELAREVLYD